MNVLNKKVGKESPSLMFSALLMLAISGQFYGRKKSILSLTTSKTNLDRQKWGKQSVLSKENTEGHRTGLETQKSAVTFPTIGPLQ